MNGYLFLVLIGTEVLVGMILTKAGPSLIAAGLASLSLL